jgi:hypothetical protein
MFHKTFNRIFWAGLIGLILAALAFRFYLPTLVKDYVNKTLDKIPGYQGHIRGIQIHLWRGAYSIHGMELVKTDGRVPVPFFSSPLINFSIYWEPLLHGSLAGKIDMEAPQLNFVTGLSEKDRQMAIDASWQDRVKELFPLRIDRLSVHNGEIHFRDYQADPPFDIFFHKVNGLASNLTNSQKISKTLKSTIDATGKAMSTGSVRTHMELDPLSKEPTFEMRWELTDCYLPDLNDYFKHYLSVKALDGTFNVYVEGTAADGSFQGYVKPMAINLNILKLKEEKKSVGEVVKGIAVKAAAVLFKNRSREQLATKINISGTWDNPEIGVWGAVGAFLHNAFIQAVPPGFEGNPGISELKKLKGNL